MKKLIFFLCLMSIVSHLNAGKRFPGVSSSSGDKGQMSKLMEELHKKLPKKKSSQGTLLEGPAVKISSKETVSAPSKYSFKGIWKKPQSSSPQYKSLVDEIKARESMVDKELIVQETPMSQMSNVSKGIRSFEQSYNIIRGQMSSKQGEIREAAERRVGIIVDAISDNSQLKDMKENIKAVAENENEIKGINNTLAEDEAGRIFPPLPESIKESYRERIQELEEKIAQAQASNELFRKLEQGDPAAMRYLQERGLNNEQIEKLQSKLIENSQNQIGLRQDVADLEERAAKLYAEQLKKEKELQVLISDNPEVRNYFESHHEEILRLADLDKEIGLSSENKQKKEEMENDPGYKMWQKVIRADEIAERGRLAKEREDYEKMRKALLVPSAQKDTPEKRTIAQRVADFLGEAKKAQVRSDYEALIAEKVTTSPQNKEPIVEGQDASGINQKLLESIKQENEIQLNELLKAKIPTDPEERELWQRTWSDNDMKAIYALTDRNVSVDPSSLKKLGALLLSKDVTEMRTLKEVQDYSLAMEIYTRKAFPRAGESQVYDTVSFAVGQVSQLVTDYKNQIQTYGYSNVQANRYKEDIDAIKKQQQEALEESIQQPDSPVVEAPQEGTVRGIKALFEKLSKKVS